MMKFSDFEKRPYIKDTLISDGYILTGAEIIGSLSYNESVNIGEDLNFGSCVVSTLEFQLSNMNDTINQMTGREFIWKRAVKTGSRPLQNLIRTTQSKLVCVNNIIAYVISERAPFLSIWNVDSPAKIKDADKQPILPVKGLVVVENRLYCLHEKEPYLAAYEITGSDLLPIAAPLLSEFEISKIKYLCLRNYACGVRTNFLKEYSVSLYDLKPDVLIETSYEYIQIGFFIAEKPIKVNNTLIKVSCANRLVKFDQYVDSWLNSINHPITLKNYLISLCNYIGVEVVNSTFLNEEYLIQKNFRTQNVTGLQVLRWIAEAAVSFCRMDELGRLVLDWYHSVNYSIDNSVYDTITIEDYMTEKIEKLQIRAVENDVGVVVPADDPVRTNTYIIENNPLLYAETDAELRPIANSIYEAIEEISYHPFSVEISDNPMIHAGQILTISTIGNQKIEAYIMSRNSSGKYDTLSAVGNVLRTTQSDAVNQQLQQLRGSIHQFTVDLTTLNSTITNYQVATDEKLEEYGVNIGSINGAILVHESSINQLATEISTKVSEKIFDENNKEVANKFSLLTQTVDGFSTTIKGQDGKISTLEQTVSGFKLAVDTKKLVFDQNGLTVYNSGFRVNNGTKDVLSVTTSGDLSLTGMFKSEGPGVSTLLSGGEIYFYKGSEFYGSIGAANSSLFGEKIRITGKLGMINAASLDTEMLQVDGNFFNPTRIKIGEIQWYVLAHL